MRRGREEGGLKGVVEGVLLCCGLYVKLALGWGIGV